MEKIESTSLDLEKLNIEKIKELFPNCVTEGKINFDALKELLGAEVDEVKEKYQITWNGKNNSIKIAQSPSTATLRPCKDKSKNWDITENLYIEGDNLEVLKQLQKTYFGKIKMIYIDPPYNTGGDFVYKDNFTDSISNYIEITSQKTSSNPETSGRFHTDWLNMMYPRLLLARNVLKDDGVLCVQIDDNEYCNLKKICDEVFGENNFMTTIVVKMSEPTGVKMSHTETRLPKLKEYILVYKKTPDVKINPILVPKTQWDDEYRLFLTNIDEKDLKFIKYVRDDENRTIKDVEKVDDLLKNIKIINVNDIYREKKIISEDDKLKFNVENAYRIVRTVSVSGRAKQLADEKKRICCSDYFSIVTPQKQMYFIKSDYDASMDQPRIKLLFADDYLCYNPCDLWTDIKTTGLDGEGFITFKNGKKPLKLLERLVGCFSNENDYVMDFFSGSGTTAEACFNVQKKNSKRKFILVQLPEKTDEYINLGFKDICDIGEERIRRSGEQIKREWEEKNKGEGLFADDSKEFPYDIGFKVFKLDSTNIKQWDNSNVLTEDQLSLGYNEVFKEDRTKEDILYEIMLKYGIFDMNATQVDINGKSMFRVGSRYMIVCLEDNVTVEDIKAICDEKPRVVVFKEDGFANDNEKINAVYNLEKAGVEDVRCI